MDGNIQEIKQYVVEWLLPLLPNRNSHEAYRKFS